MLQQSLQLVEAGQDLSLEETAETLGQIMEGGGNEEQIARLLIALHAKGETVAEVAGAARAMRNRMTSIRSRRTGLLDTCGTGGDGSKTFNISTVAAIVTAAAGVPVAKHGNRAATSRCGSADVLAELGVNVEADVSCVEGCLDELGICFCFAPLLHRAMKYVAPVRKQIATPTIFNILGPLVNPAGAEFQLLGVGKVELQSLLAEALLLLGVRRALVVHGSDGLDEVTLFGPTQVLETTEGRLRHFEWVPEDFGIASLSKEANKDSFVVSGPGESAAIIRSILKGQGGAARDIVLLNAAAAIYTANISNSLPQCTELAVEAIDSGKAMDLLDRLGDRTRG